MKTGWWLVVLTGALTLSACGERSAVDEVPKSIDIALQNPGFEETGPGDSFPGWNSIQHAGDQAYVTAVETSEPGAGKQSLRLTQILPEYYGTVEQHVTATPDMIGRIVEFSALARTHEVGPDGWSLFINFFDQSDHFIAQVVSPALLGTTPWQRISVSAKVPPNTGRFIIAAQMTDPSSTGNNGVGWLDDAQFRVLAPSESTTGQ